MATNIRAKQAVRHFTERGGSCSLRILHQISPEFLRVSRSVRLFNVCANGAVEEAVISALLILASSFSCKPVMLPVWQDVGVRGYRVRWNAGYAGFALLRKCLMRKYCRDRGHNRWTNIPGYSLTSGCS